MWEKVSDVLNNLFDRREPVLQVLYAFVDDLCPASDVNVVAELHQGHKVRNVDA